MKIIHIVIMLVMVLITVNSALALAPNELDLNPYLVHYWALNETTGATITDFGTSPVTLTRTRVLFSNGYTYLNGTNSQIENSTGTVGVQASISKGLSNVSSAAWGGWILANFTQYSVGSMFVAPAYFTGVSSQGYYIIVTNRSIGNVSYGAQVKSHPALTSPSITTVRNYSASVPHHVMVNFVNRNLSIYVDGVWDNSFILNDTYLWLATGGNNATYLSGTYNTNLFKGALKEVFVFNTSLTQSQIANLANNNNNFTFSVIDAVFSTPVCNFTAMVNGTTYISNVSLCNVATNISRTATVNITINLSSVNYYSSSASYKINDTSVLSLYPVYDAQLTVTAFNLSGSAVNIFTVNFTDVNTGELFTDSTSSASTITNLRAYHNYSTLIDANNYAFGYALNNVTLGSNTQVFTLYPSNSIDLSIYDALTSMLISQEINIIVTGSVVNNYSTTTGNKLLLNVENGLIEIKAYNNNYSQGRIYVSVTNRSTQFASMYLTPNASASVVQINWFDVNGAPISGLYATESVVTSNGSVLSGSYFSDITGATYFSYNDLYYYIYNCSSTIYACNGFILNPPRNPSYDVTLAYLTPETSYSIANVTGFSSFNNISKILSFNYISYESGVHNYSYQVIMDINGFISLCSSNSTSSSDSFTCDLTGRSGTVYVQGIIDGALFYSVSYYINPLPSLFDNLNAKDAAFYTGLLLLIIIFASLIAGIVGTLISTVIGLIVLNMLGISNLITVPIIIITAIVSIIIIMGLKRR